MLKKTVYIRERILPSYSDWQELDRRIRAAQELYKNIPRGLSKSAYEFLDVFDNAGGFFGRVNLWAAGCCGVRHKTTNAILITPDNKVISQLRAKNSFLFPNRYSLSVGGHLSYATLDAPRLSPRQTIVKELAEEFGLLVNPRRFKCLGDFRGIPNFLKVWRYCDVETKIMFTQFDAAGQDIGIDVLVGNPTGERLRQIVAAIREQRAVSGLTLECWNEEICYYYTLRITQKELHAISFADGEVSGMKLLAAEDMIAAGKKLHQTTDNLYSLFYDRQDIARELMLRVTGAPDTN